VCVCVCVLWGISSSRARGVLLAHIRWASHWEQYSQLDTPYNDACFCPLCVCVCHWHTALLTSPAVTPTCACSFTDGATAGAAPANSGDGGGTMSAPSTPKAAAERPLTSTPPSITTASTPLSPVPAAVMPHLDLSDATLEALAAKTREMATIQVCQLQMP
jgi:hypothetical protein